MVSDSAKEELRKRFYYVSHRFGGVDNFIEQLSNLVRINPLSIEEKVHRILTHPSSIIIITPWSILIDLSKEEGSRAIILNKPYGIYNLEGRLIYKVLEHQGYFGNSPLDKALALSSNSGELFYLQFSTYSGSETYLLVVNNLALNYSSPISDKDYLKAPKPREVEPSDNHITLDASPIINGLTNIGIRFIKGNPGTIPSLEDMYNISSSMYYLDDTDPLLLYIPKDSGWLLFTKEENQGSIPLFIKDIEGVGTDRFIQANDYLWYIAIGDEIDTNVLRQSLNIVSRRPPDFSTYNVIRLGGTLYV